MSVAAKGAGWQVDKLNEIPPVKPDWPATWKSVRHHFGITAFGINAVTKDAGKVLIPEHDEAESGQQEMYFVHAGAGVATLDGEQMTVARGRDDRRRAGGHAQVRVDRQPDHPDRGRGTPSARPTRSARGSVAWSSEQAPGPAVVGRG